MALLANYALEKHLGILSFVFSVEDTVQHKSPLIKGDRMSLWLGQDVCLGLITKLCKTATHKQWYCHLTVLNTNKGSALKLIQREKYCFFGIFLSLCISPGRFTWFCVLSDIGGYRKWTWGSLKKVAEGPLCAQISKSACFRCWTADMCKQLSLENLLYGGPQCFAKWHCVWLNTLNKLFLLELSPK